MRISRVSLRNILGLESLEFDAGKVTTIRGDNGTGKTSTIEALRGALGGGDLAKLIRTGEDHAEIVVVFDDESKLTTKIGAKTTRRIEDANGYAMGTAKQWIDAHLNQRSFSPVAFVEATPKQRLEQVVECSHLELDFADLAAAAKPCPGIKDLIGLTGDEKCSDPLRAIEIIDKRVREYRLECNRSVKDKRSHISELEESLPAGAVQAVDPQPLRDELESIRSAHQKAKSTAMLTAKDAEIKINKKAADAEAQARQQLVDRLAEISAKKESAMRDVQRCALEAVGAIDAEYDPRIEAKRDEITRAEEAAKAADGAKRTKEAIERARGAAAAFQDESDAMTNAIERLAKLKLRVMEKLPVPGLSVFDGQLFFNKPSENPVPVETLNTAELIDVAMRIAETCAADLKVICMDGMERLGRKKQKAFEERAATSDCQFFVTAVASDEPLTITAED